LEAAEIPVIVGTFRQAALNAIEAGFDGVELQGANSHLIEQFLEDGTNTRTDNYGGSPENRARFLLDIVGEASAAIGVDRLGVRLSPFGRYGGIHDSKAKELFMFVIKELNERHLAYLHLIEARGSEIGLADGKRTARKRCKQCGTFPVCIQRTSTFCRCLYTGQRGRGDRAKARRRNRVRSTLHCKPGFGREDQEESTIESF
jgi:2,4-dienoyl-CoA reductase-like NADH-dependent reductase (Old Yellow Enzyme family)